MAPEPPPYDSTGIQYHTVPSFKFLNPEVKSSDIKVAYRSFNPSSTAGTVLIPTCFAGHVNTTLHFSKPPYDALSRYHVVVAAMLGNGESASPSNNPSFPKPGQLHYEDVIRAHYHLLTEGLGVKQLEAVVGFSMGGQQTYHWAVMFPDYVKRTVGICTSARTSPHNYAFLEGPIAALETSADYVSWKETPLSSAAKRGKPRRGLAAFSRAYAAWLTSTAWFRQKHWKDTLGFASVEDWLLQLDAGRVEWNPDDLLVLARMWQLGDIGKTARQEMTRLGGGQGDDEQLKMALQGIKAKVLLMPNRTDQYFPPEDNEWEMQYLKNGRLEVIESVWGHTSGGGLNPADREFMNAKIKEFMDDGDDDGESSVLPIRGHGRAAL